MDILIQNAKLIDGTGKCACTGNIGIHQGKLVLSNLPDTADEVIDATGKYLAPGFIDVHSHGDELIGSPGSFGDLCKVNQGFTTQIGGQCGVSGAPTTAAFRQDPVVSLDAMSPRLLQLRRDGLTWPEYAEFIRSVPKVTNYKLFVGFNAIRIAAMGYADRKPTDPELAHMKAMLKDAMEAGAVGMSSGLAYVPGTYAETEELIALCKVMAPYGGIYATHMRNESKDLLTSVKEAIRIGKEAGVAVHISHFKVMGRDYWGNHKAAIAEIEKARAEGQDITCDQYPYNCSMTIYTPCMPPWYFTEGTESLVDKLHDPALRAKIREEMEDPASDYENFYRNSGGWDGVTICACPNTPEAEGKSIAAYAAELGKDPFEAYFDLVIANRGMGTAVYHSISDDDIFDIIRLPYVMVGSDGLVGSRDEKCHPRGWGTMARAICAMTKDNPILPLETLIHRNTGMAAARFGLASKGLLKEGYDADLVLFDYEALQDNATYANPNALAGGIERVFIAGQTVYQDGKLTGATPGKLL